MTTPRLRPMSDTDRPEKIVLFYSRPCSPIRTLVLDGSNQTDAEDIGWCTVEEAEVIVADLLERIKPPEPNPVYWGDEVVSNLSGTRFMYVGPSHKDKAAVWCEGREGGSSGLVSRSALTHNGKPITEFCHGKRPDSQSTLSTPDIASRGCEEER